MVGNAGHAGDGANRVDFAARTDQKACSIPNTCNQLVAAGQRESPRYSVQRAGLGLAWLWRPCVSLRHASAGGTRWQNGYLILRLTADSFPRLLSIS